MLKISNNTEKRLMNSKTTFDNEENLIIYNGKSIGVRTGNFKDDDMYPSARKYVLPRYNCI